MSMEDLRKKPGGCPFELLCEERYPEADMAEQRTQCSEQNCRRCYHYRGFYDGFFDLDEQDPKGGMI